MKEIYQVEITKIVDGKKTEYLCGDVKSIDDLVENIESFVERMRPLTKEQKEEVSHFLASMSL